MIRNTLTTAACLLMATAAVAADPVTGTTYRAKEVLGSKILIGSTHVGTIEDLVFDDAGNLEYLIVEDGGKLTTVPFEAAKFDVKRREAVLTIQPDVYRAIPTYTVATYPTFYAPTYRTEIYKHYGVSPRELRRLGNPRR